MNIHNINFHDKEKFFLYIPEYLFYWAIGGMGWGLKNEFEPAMVNKPLVFKSLKVYRIQHHSCLLHIF